jgi:hypothetical protein
MDGGIDGSRLRIERVVVGQNSAPDSYSAGHDEPDIMADYASLIRPTS